VETRSFICTSIKTKVFYLVAGKIGLQCGPEKLVLNVGDTFMAPMNVPHAYVTLGSEPARMLNVFDPAGEIEDFFPSMLTCSAPRGRRT
jgi:quercetin dioxygenase-like cupin family protein